MYLNYFGLKSKPFSFTSDPNYLYLSKHHREALDALQYGIENRVGFIEITGEIGSGKTTLCRALLKSLPANCESAYLFNSSLSEIQFLQTLLSDLGVNHAKHKNRHALFSLLNEYLISKLSENKNVVLIVDEAQNITVKLLEQIRMLSNLETEKDKLIQIVLVGQPELRDKLRLPALKQLRQRIAIRHHLKPLSSDEVSQYLSHRMSIAGCDKNIFDSNAIEMIATYSCGVPRVINIITDKSLLAAFAHGSSIVSEKEVSRAIEELDGVHA